MCEFCTKHGEGKKWYLNVKNYSDDLMADVNRKKLVKDHFYWLDRTYSKYFNLVKMFPYDAPLIGPFFKKIIKGIFFYKHWGQAIPIEDVENILNFTNSITRVPCICRKITTGKEKRLCFLISLNPSKLGIASVIDPSYFGGPDVSKFERVDKDWALSFMRESETKGMIHMLWALKAPFAGIICNCDYSTGCLAMKMINEATSITFRAEYVAKSNTDACLGCKECIKLCQFKAIKLDSKTMKIKIDSKKCYGCGICRSACRAKVISLVGRSSVAEAAHLW